MQDSPAHILVNGIRSSLEGTVVALPCPCTLNWKMPRTKSSPGVSEVSRAASAELRWIWPFRTESWKINNDCIIRYEAEISVRPVPVGVYIYRGRSPVQRWVNNNVHTADWAMSWVEVEGSWGTCQISLSHWSRDCTAARLFARGLKSPFVVPVSGSLETRPHQMWEFVFFLLGLPSAF